MDINPYFVKVKGLSAAHGIPVTRKLLEFRHLQSLPMKKFCCAFALAGVLFFEKANAQDGCPGDVHYYTATVSNGKESMPLPLKFMIRGDSIFISSPSGNRSLLDVAFYIKSSTCQWNAQRTESESRYQLALQAENVVKYPAMTISFKAKLRTILLQYEGSEQRIFEIVEK